MGTANHKLANQSVAKSFFQYFIPTLFGMMLMSVNIVIDGIFVGNGVGSIALASVNIAVPVFSVIISVALLIGMGGGTLYSIALGQGNHIKAQKTFTLSMIFITVITLIITIVSYLNLNTLAYWFGANEETLPYTLDYMRIMFLLSIVMSLETSVSIFIRNDGAPQLAMAGLVISAIANIGLNYWMIFILGLEVKGAAYATMIATGIGLLTYTLHFFNKQSNLKFTRIKWNWKEIKSISIIGFPSFLSEAGMGVFVIGYNVAMTYHVGTEGLSAFSVINYLHTFMFLAFIALNSTLQPMISYYYGAKQSDHIKKTIKIAEVTAFVLGITFITVGFIGAKQLVNIFGIESTHVIELAANGLKIFFLGYLFMGINFIYMTYYQAIGQIGPSIGITMFRGIILLSLSLLTLPFIWGINGIWLSLPVAEAIVAIFLLIYTRKRVMSHNFVWRKPARK